MISDLCHYNDTRAWKTIPIFGVTSTAFLSYFGLGLNKARNWTGSETGLNVVTMWVELSCIGTAVLWPCSAKFGGGRGVLWHGKSEQSAN